MKTFISILAFIAIGLSQQGGCVSTGALPFVTPAANVQVSSYSVQAAEKLLKQAKLTSQLFFDLVRQNHDFVVANLPDVYAFAQRMQTEMPNKLRQANAAKNEFKYNRTSDNQASMDTIMKTVSSLMSLFQTKTTELKAATP